MKKKRINEIDVTRYVALKRIVEEAKEEIESLEDKFTKAIPIDHTRIVGIYRVFHSTGQKRIVAWKQVCLKYLGEKVVNKILDKAPLGNITHNIKVKQVGTASLIEV